MARVPTALSYPAAELKRCWWRFRRRGRSFAGTLPPRAVLPEIRWKNAENWLENEHLRVTAKGAFLTIWVKKTGRVFERQAEVIEVAEGGDLGLVDDLDKVPAYTSGSAAAEVEILRRGGAGADARALCHAGERPSVAGRRSAEMAVIP
jgi:hypothetical protein